MADKTLRLTIVTPEKTLLDEPVSSLSFPLYDGEIGILPGRLPMIGRLGAGELKVVQTAQTRRYFIEGGFVQVNGNAVTLLTNGAVPVTELNATQAQVELDAALARKATTEEALKSRADAQDRARRKLSLARRPR